MVDVGVRKPDRFELGAGRADSAHESLAVRTRIDDHRPAHRLVDDEIAVLLESADGL
jgi:hypothetical protein